MTCVLTGCDLPRLLGSARARSKRPGWAWLHDQADGLLISSALAWVEVLRPCRRIDEHLLDTGRAVIAALHLVPLDDAVLGSAADLPGSDLRSLDALHLASALRIGADLGAFVAYDGRLLGAAAEAGLPVIRPTA